jgi:ATP phosphoribosyltransferase
MLNPAADAKNKLKLGIPKGSLQETAMSLFRRVGLEFTGGSRSLWLASSDPEIVPVLLKPQEIPVYVEAGQLDAGLTGLDWIVERDVEARTVSLAELPFSKQTNRPVRWVLAVPDASPLRTIEDFRAEAERRGVAEARSLMISTELTRISGRWLARHGIEAEVQFSWGATEAKAGYFVDAVVESVETGSSLAANGLRVVSEVFRSTPHFIANKRVYRGSPAKRGKLDGLAHLLVGAVRADEMVQLTMLADRDFPVEKIPSEDARLVMSRSKSEGHPTFIAVVILRKSSIPAVLPWAIASGATTTWVSPIDILYHQEDHASVANPDGAGPGR